MAVNGISLHIITCIMYSWSDAALCIHLQTINNLCTIFSSEIKERARFFLHYSLLSTTFSNSFLCFPIDKFLILAGTFLVDGIYGFPVDTISILGIFMVILE